jgi:hypothetical protein
MTNEFGQDVTYQLVIRGEFDERFGPDHSFTESAAKEPVLAG